MPSLFLSVALLLLERWAISTDWLSISYYADAFANPMAMFWPTVFHLRIFRLMHTQYNWQLILFDSAVLHVLDPQMLQPLYSFASFLHTWFSIQWYVLIRYGYIREVYQSVHCCHRICIPSVISNLFLAFLSVPFNIKMAYCFILVILFEGALRICAQSLQWIFVFQLIQVVILICMYTSRSRSQIKGRITKFWSSIDFTSWSTSWLLSSIAHQFNFTVRDILFLCQRILYKYYSWWSSVAFCTSTDCCYSSIFPLCWSAATMEDLFLFISLWFLEN